MGLSTGFEHEAYKLELEQVETAHKEVERGLTNNKVRIMKINDQLRTADAQLSKVLSQLRGPTLSADEKDVLVRARVQLRTEKEQLRTEMVQLRTEMVQLRTEKIVLLDARYQLRTEQFVLLDAQYQLRTEQRRRADVAKLAKDAADLYMRRAWLVDSPSTISLKREQLDLSGPLFNNWRLTSTAAGQLPELSHPVFGKVADIIAGHDQPDQASVAIAVDLICICADIKDNEAVLTKDIRAKLEPYLADVKIVTIGSGFTANKVSPDWALGDSSENPSNVFLIFEAKVGIGGSGDSHFQGAAYHLHFWRERNNSAIFRNTVCPAFLLEVVGPHVRLSAVAWLDRVTIFPLTPLLNLLPAHPITDCLLMPVARMLAALRTGLRELAVAHEAALQQPAAANKALPLPWPISTDPRYDPATVIHLAPRNPTYYVRRAGSSDGSGGGGGPEAVAVKLCRKYGLTTHCAWADLGLAPKVLHTQPLPGGWLLVEMEWLPRPEWRQLSELQGRERAEALGQVKEELTRAHKETGMVHGDMRPPNCLVRRDASGTGSWQVHFVDFEWAGREGEFNYPPCLNPDIPWPEGVAYGKPLQLAHDLQLLAATTASPSVGERDGAWGAGAVKSLHTAASDRCAVPLRKVVGVMLHRGVGWRQRVATGWVRPAAPGRRLAW